MSTGSDIRLLNQHNVERNRLQGMLVQARDLNDSAAAMARLVYRESRQGHQLVTMANALSEAIVKAAQLNERLQAKALEIIAAMES